MISTADDLKNMIFKSLAFHASILVIFSVKAVFFPSEIPDYSPAIRVDIVGLPDKKMPELPIQEKKIEPVPSKPQTSITEKAKPAEKAAKKELLKEQTSALSKLKTLSAIEKLKQQSPAAPAPVIKGNILSPGTALRGLNKLQFNEYIGAIDTHIKNNWLLPEWMLQQQLRAEILVRIDSTGQLIEKRFIKKSGNAEFDQRVASAIEKAVPFPAPPEKFIDLVGVQGITFAFPE